MVKRKSTVPVKNTGSAVTALSFKGINVPTDATFSVYGSKKDTIVQGDNEKFEYEGQTEPDQNEYCVAAYDPDTNTVELFPSTLVNVTGSLKRKRDLGPAVRQSNVRGSAQRTALGEAFGTKKAKKAITEQERNRIDAEKLEDFETAIVNTVKTSTDSLPSQEERSNLLQSDRPIPPHDLETHKVSEVYPLSGIIPKKEYNAIRVGTMLKETDPAKRLASLPNKSRIISDRLYVLDTKPGDHTELLKQIYYASLLVAVYDNRRVNNKMTLTAKLGAADILVNGVLDRFAVSKTGQVGRSKDKNFTIDPVHENKLLCYLLALLLRIDNYTLEIGTLAKELSLKQTKLVELLRAMGCNVKNATQTQAEALGIPKSQAGTTKVAVLSAPLTLPDLTKRKRK